MPLDVDPTTAKLARPESLQLRPGLRDDSSSLVEQLGAAFSLDNTVVSTYNYLSRERPPAEPDFDPMAHLEPGEEPVAGRFVNATSLAEMAQIREKTEQERELRRKLGNGPIPEFLASALAILADPTTYIPIAGQVGKGATVAGKAARLAGGTAVEVAASEAILQATQYERPIEETVAAIMMGGAFGAGIGGVVGARQAAKTKAYKAAVEDFTALARGAAEESGQPFAAQSAGAAAVGPRVRPEDTKLVSSAGVAEAVAKLDKIGLASPAIVLATSENAASREFVHTLVDTGMVTKGQVKGLTMSEEGPVDLLIRRHQNTSNMAIGGILKEGLDAHKLSGGVLSRAQFSEEVGRALRRGDNSSDPAVKEAARRVRAEILDPLKKEAIEAKLLPADVDTTTALSYFTRVYNREKIKANRPDFRNAIMTYLRRVVPVEELAGEMEYKEMADAIIDRILGYEHGRVPFMNVPRLRGPLKERTFNIPDNMIEAYLVSDVSRVGQFYVNTMVSDIQMARLSQRLGFGGRADDVGRSMREKILEEAKAKVDALDKPGSKLTDAQKEKQRVALMDKAEREGELVEGLVDLIRGTMRNPMDPSYMGLRRVGKVVRTLNYMRLLGSVLLSSIPDMGRIVMEEGLARSMGTVLSDSLNGFKGIRMARKEAQAAGTANEIFLATRVRAQYDLGERYAQETAFERGLDKAGQWFGIATLLTPWNEAMKSITSALVSTRILSAVEGLATGGKLSDRDLRKLAVAGINEGMARRIAAEAKNFDRHGTVIIANTEAWKDAGAVEAFRSALMRDVDNTVITPGKGDAPLWTSTEWGKTVFQFKRFGAAATQRILVSGLQTRDVATLNGLMVMVGLGALGTMAREWSTDGEIKQRSGRQWAVEALDRSGALSMLYEMDAIADKISGGNVSLQRLAAGDETTRFKSRDVVGQILGPTAGGVTDVAKAITGVAEKDLTQADLHRVRRLFPGQNLFYIRYLLDRMEKGAADRFDLPEKQASGASARRTPALPGEP